MPEPSRSWTHYRARIAGKKRHDPNADTSADERDLHAARLEDFVRRAIDDPAQLARAARIVRTALARQRLTLHDLAPDRAPTSSTIGQDGGAADAA